MKNENLTLQSSSDSLKRVIGFHRYELTPVKASRRARQGVLFRYDLGGGGIGYADVHPWPELGDLDVEAHIEMAASGRLSPLLDQAAERAHLFVDGAQPKLAKPGTPGLPNHASLPYLLSESCESKRFTDSIAELAVAGFTAAKLKLGDDLESESERLVVLLPALLDHGFKLRLDLNQKTKLEQVLALCERLRAVTGELEWLDWLEDPCPWEPRDWAELRTRFGIRLAVDFAAGLDREGIPGSVDIAVYKPVRDSASTPHVAKDLGLTVCVTSCLDHPLGQVAANAVAQQLVGEAAGPRLEAGGLCTHTLYKPTPFSDRLAIRDTRLEATDKEGIDFSDLLARLPWEKL